MLAMLPTGSRGQGEQYEAVISGRRYRSEIRFDVTV
jgi:hypothetical protein